MVEHKPQGDPPVAVAPEPAHAAGTAPHPRPIGPEELKAFTHPLRMAMYSALRDQGSATASQLARRLGESSGQTSYHLRQLERHGFIEDDPEHSGGRERWWRPVGFSVEDPALLADTGGALAVRAMLDQELADRVRVIRRWIDSVIEGKGADEKAQILDTMTVDMTTDEATALIEEVQHLLEEHRSRATAHKAQGEGEGRRRTRIYFDLLPLPLDAVVAAGAHDHEPDGPVARG
ncbi:MAG TPA: helix-turn-helix domain-containing protein [Cellulomonas sp.]